MFNWLFARRNGGAFVVRIEDTDQARLTPGAVEAILEGLRWLGIDWDEGPGVEGGFGPYEQSRRLGIYQGLAGRLVAQGDAYYCYCRREDLERRRMAGKGEGGAAAGCGCREGGRAGAAGEPTDDDSRVVRFAMPRSGVTRVRDLIRGEVEWRNELEQDFVILKSDGFPTYHLAVVADDHLMEISHVMRAEEWLPSTPRHWQLYRALGFAPPEFAHLPMITGADRAKLSKRHGATAIGEYREEGYLPEALLNFMALLGWSLDGSTEVASLELIRDNFTIERITKSAAIFDRDKLLWMNGVYIRQLEAGDLARRMLPFMGRELDDAEREYLGRIAPLVRERMKRLDEAAGLTGYFFGDLADYDPLALVPKGMDAAGARAALLAAAGDLAADAGGGDFGGQYLLKALLMPSQQQPLGLMAADTAGNNFKRDKLEELLGVTGGRLGLSRRQFFGLLRVALTGRGVSPPLFEMMEVMGRGRVLARLRAAADLLAGVDVAG